MTTSPSRRGWAGGSTSRPEPRACSTALSSNGGRATCPRLGGVWGDPGPPLSVGVLCTLLPGPMAPPPTGMQTQTWMAATLTGPPAPVLSRGPWQGHAQVSCSGQRWLRPGAGLGQCHRECCTSVLSPHQHRALAWDGVPQGPSGSVPANRPRVGEATQRQAGTRRCLQRFQFCFCDTGWKQRPGLASSRLLRASPGGHGALCVLGRLISRI